MKKGRLICLEGIEGTGKTTQMRWIANYLRSLEQSVVTTREPGGTVYAEGIRQLILQPPPKAEPLTKEAELLLLFAARAQHITQVIRPALQAGHWVICDRFTEASYAYQGGGRGVSKAFIEYLEQNIYQDISINHVLLFDMPIDQALQQMKQRNKVKNQASDRIELETEAFFKRVREAYLFRAKENKVPYSIIQANNTLTQVQTEVAAVLNRLLS